MENDVNCPICGCKLIKRKGSMWENEKNKCLVCSGYPKKCSFKKLYAEKREESSLWNKIKEAMNRNKKCELCGSELILRKRLSGKKEGNRYWVCSRFPECNYRKLYAEQGKPVGPWEKIGRLFVKRS